MGWGESRKSEKKCARRTGVRGGLCLSVVSVKEKDIGVGNQLRENNEDGQIPGVMRRKKLSAYCLDSLLRPSTNVNAEHTLSTPSTLSCKSIQTLKVAQRRLD